MFKAQISSIAAAVVLSAVCLHGQARGVVVTLKVSHDGVETTAPSRLTLDYDEHSVRLAVRSGRFTVPQKVLQADEFTLSFGIGREEIRIRGIKKHDFLCNHWRVILADENYGNDWPVPKGTDVRSSCIVAFDPEQGDGTFVLVPGCRSSRR